MAALTHPPSKLFVVAAFVLIVLTQICKGEYKTVLYSNDVDDFEKGAVILDDGNYVLEFKTHCRLKIYQQKNRIVTWTSNGRKDMEFCVCIFEPWGNLEVIGDNGVVWAALRSQPKMGNYVLILQRKGDLAIHGSSLWSTSTAVAVPEVLADDRNSVMYSGDNLNPGDSLEYGKYSLKMQTDCNLVLYDDETAIWATNTTGKSFNCVCKFQEDANLVVYGGDEEPIWASKTNRDDFGNYLLVLQKDRNLVIYGTPLWDSEIDNKPSLKAKVANSTTTDAITQAIGIATVV